MSSNIILLELIKEKEKIEDLIKINNINIDIYKNRKQVANNLLELNEYAMQINKIEKLSNKYEIDLLKIKENIEDKLFVDKQKTTYINLERLELKVKNLESAYLISIILLLSYYYYKK
jgi:predicted small integral membrane protein